MSLNAFIRQIREQWLDGGDRGSRRRKSGRRPAKRRRTRLGVEALEARDVPALPAPTITDPGVDFLFRAPADVTLGFSGLDPKIVVDPTNPNNIVAVATTVNVTAPGVSPLVGAFSNDGGQTWGSMTSKFKA